RHPSERVQHHDGLGRSPSSQRQICSPENGRENPRKRRRIRVEGVVAIQTDAERSSDLITRSRTGSVSVARKNGRSYGPPIHSKRVVRFIAAPGKNWGPRPAEDSESLDPSDPWDRLHTQAASCLSPAAACRRCRLRPCEKRQSLYRRKGWLSR